MTVSCPNLQVSCDRFSYLLADFGISQEIKSSDFDLRLGDNLYLSPELHSIFGLNIDEQLKKADVYALGLIFAQLILGSSTSPGLHVLEKPDEKASFKNREDLVNRLRNANFSSRLKNIVLDCLKPDPKMRPDSLSLLASINAYAFKKSAPILLYPINCRTQSRTMSSSGLPVQIKVAMQEATKKNKKPSNIKKLIQF